MRILIIGGYGIVGGTATKALSGRHDVIVAGRTRGDVQVDISDIDSIRAMYDTVPNLDAVVCAAGAVKWDQFDNLAARFSGRPGFVCHHSRNRGRAR